MAISGTTDKIPDGFTAPLGLYIINWGIFDTIIDAAIMKLLRLSPMEAAILTSSLQHKAKISVLRSLLNLDPARNAEALSVLGKITSMAGRNAIMHGHVSFSDTEIVFVKMDADAKLVSKEKRYSKVQFLHLIGELAGLLTKTQKLLDISDEMRIRIPKIGANLVSKTSTSPTSPSAKKTLILGVPLAVNFSRNLHHLGRDFHLSLNLFN